jgi:hypothetical protein
MRAASHSDQTPITLPLVILQMAMSAIAFIFVLGIVALVMPLWQFGHRLIRAQRPINTAIDPMLAFEFSGDIRMDEQHLLRRLLADEVQSSFKPQQERPSQKICELLEQLERITPPFPAFAR